MRNLEYDFGKNCTKGCDGWCIASKRNKSFSLCFSQFSDNPIIVNRSILVEHTIVIVDHSIVIVDHSTNVHHSIIVDNHRWVRELPLSFLRSDWGDDLSCFENVAFFLSCGICTSFVQLPKWSICRCFHCSFSWRGILASTACTCCWSILKNLAQYYRLEHRWLQFKHYSSSSSFGHIRGWLSFATGRC